MKPALPLTFAQQVHLRLLAPRAAKLDPELGALVLRLARGEDVRAACYDRFCVLGRWEEAERIKRMAEG